MKKIVILLSVVMLLVTGCSVTKLDSNEIPSEVLLNEDKFLRLDLINRKLTDAEKLSTISRYKY